MKLEFLPDGSDDCPLLRLYDFRPAEISRLWEVLSGLGAGSSKTVAIHQLPGVEAIGGCRLILRVGPRDRGLAQLPGKALLECTLSADGWQDVAELTHPFVEGSGGFQWLSTIGGVKWLLSADGHW